ncbi:MAG: GNAT family N-acetyltransferase [Candidatus Zixiibacteriota bacterium]|nr:MAG: GNAT family N-acetyltransferase [candidate division Zixibacteria bacterium]
MNFDTVRQLEQIEQHAWTDFHRAAPTNIASEYAISARMTDSACCAIAAKIDVLALNRVMGLLKGRRTIDDEIDSWIEAYKSAGAGRFFVQPSPTALEDQIEHRLERKGFRHYNNWVKLYRKLDPLPPIRSDLGTRQIGPDEGGTFGQIVAECFEWPEIAVNWLAATVGRPNWHHFMAYAADRPVATAAMYTAGDYAWADFAATLAAYRGRGAQSVLMARRLEAAANAGCRWLIVETAENREGKPAPSFRNMVRYGFTQAYVRPNYLWTFG